MSQNIKLDAIKKLRLLTGAGLSDVKEALDSNDYNEEKALEFLKKKGLARVAKRGDRSATDGVIISYIHNTNKAGALVQVNCETDFVAKSPDFIEFARNIALQVVAMNPTYISKDSLSNEEKNKLYEDLLKNDDLNKESKLSKDQVIEKYLNEYCLLEQVYFKDGKTKISDMLAQISAKMGEKIEIARFTLYKI